MPNVNWKVGGSGTPVSAEMIADMKTKLGLNLVTNKHEDNLSIGVATQAALDLKSPLASPNFTGAPAANGLPLATRDYVDSAAGGANKYAVHSAFGEGLVDHVVSRSGIEPEYNNVLYFSTLKAGDIEATIYNTDSDLFRIIRFDGTLGSQYACPEGSSFAFDPGGERSLPRACGVMCVGDGESIPLANASFIQISLENNGITAINLAGDFRLSHVSLRNNKLSKLVLPAGFASEFAEGSVILDFSQNQITEIDLSAAVGLTYLYCFDNKLTTLDLTNNTGLINLYCGGNLLLTLDVSNQPNLTQLSCAGHMFTTLDLAENLLLESLQVYGGPLETLDLSNNPALALVWLNDNALTLETVDDILLQLDTHGLGGSGDLRLQGGTNSPPTFASTTTLAGSNFSCVGTTVTVTHTAHGYATGDALSFVDLEGISTVEAGLFYSITVTGPNTYTFETFSSPLTATGSGTATIREGATTTKNLVGRAWLIITN